MSGDLGNHIVSPVTSPSFSAFKLTIKSWCCKRMRKNHIIFQTSSKEQKKFYQLILCTQRLGPLTLFISGHTNFVNLMVLGTQYPTILWWISSTSFISSVWRYPPTVNSPKYLIGNTLLLRVVSACDATRWCFKTRPKTWWHGGICFGMPGGFQIFITKWQVPFESVEIYVFHCLDSYFGTLNVLTLKWTFKSSMWNHPPKVTLNHVASIIWGIIWLRISGRFCAKYSWDERHARQEQKMWTSTKKVTIY